MLTTDHLLCEYAENPLAVDTRTPRLSWQLQAKIRGVRQTAYQLLVASTCEGLEAGKPDLWDSGKVESTAQIVEYAGQPLSSRQSCWWQVRVWDQYDVVSEYSPIASFELGLAPEDWIAEWIGNPGVWINRALYFRRVFDLEKPVRRARIYMAGLGWSELYVNGQRPNDRVLDPAQSDYSRRILYTTDAVEGLLHEGKNVIGVVVGNGWYGTVRLLLQMEIEFTDGSSQRIISKVSWLEPWLVTAGPILENSVYDGEVYDARLEIEGWCEAECPESHSVWMSSLRVGGPGGKLVPAQLEPIRVADTLRVREIHHPKPGVYVFDLGQNFAGWALLKVNGPAGQRISLRFSESLYPDGTVNQENLRTAKAEDVYILKGGGEEIWEPRFTYHGFRYIQVEGYPGEPGPEAVQGRVVRSGVEAVGSFECSNELINRIQRMIWWTESSNLHSIPTDCPQRDERMGWLNDLAARSEEVIYNFDLARFFSKFVGDIADAQDSSTGAISDTAPFRWGRRPADPVSVCYLLIPWLLYTHHGDSRTMAEYYGGMKHWVNYLTSRAEDNILSYSYYADWVPPMSEISPESSGGLYVARETPGNLISTACYAYSARLLSQIAKVLGKKRDASAYFRLSKRIAEEYNRCFWNEEAGGYGSSNQACNAISLYMGLVPEQRRKTVEASMVRDVHEHDNHLNTGNICTKYLLEALSAAGHSDLASAIVLQESYPSWGYMLSNGATTLWERWEHTTGGGMNSHNHPMMGSVGAWFYRVLAGVQAHEDGPGFSHFSIRPEIIPGLDWVDSKLQTVRGQVKLEWNHTGGDLDISVQVPYGSVARVIVPTQDHCAISESGILVWHNEQSVALPEGVHFAKREKDGVVFSLGGGVYNFRSQF